MIATASSAAEGLKTMRRVAGAALLAVFGGMIAFRLLEPAHPAFGYLRAFCEAATVGALADWFAVVALFRHPLGIPNRHTAILPNNKDRVAESLGQFVTENFLTEEQLAPRIREIDYAALVALWLQDHGDVLADHLTRFTPQLLAGMPDKKIADLLAAQSRGLIRKISVGPLIGGGLGGLVQNGRDREIFSTLLHSAEELVTSHRVLIETKIREEIPLPVEFLRSLPGLSRLESTMDQLKDALAASVASRTIEKVRGVLAEAQHDPGHPLRIAFTKKLTDFIDELNSSPQMAEEIRGFQDAMADDPSIDRFSRHAWDEVKAYLLADCRREDSAVRAQLRAALAAAAAHVAENPDSRRELNDAIGGHVLKSLLAARPVVHDLVTSTVRGWDGEEMARRLETTVGRDLQFIRLNGTIIGGLVGLIFHAGFALAGR